eukprot:TRINITY_DN167_c2_g1_i1.p1 TRINITY_DN167_c2_g1~~TRINITY_DN167_c2_g1_i1.p1  ORF type:complete len:354 (+),score=52.27 TRINITY_DN167_c2_g1_i1:291-1352(+)
MPGITGFADAPCSKASLVFTWVLSIVSYASGRQESLVLDVSKALGSAQLWRLWTCHFIWTGVGEALVGSMLLYHFRVLERQMGSRKFGTFAVIVGILSSVMLLAAGSLAVPGLQPAAGPIPLVFALLVLYHVCVPVLQPRLLGLLSLNFTEKSVAYALAIQLALSQGPSTLAPAICGLVIGAAYRLDLFKLQRAHLPAAVYRLCSKLHPCFRSLRRPEAVPVAAARGLRRRLTPPRQRSLLPQISGGGNGGGISTAIGGGAARSRAGAAQRAQQQQQLSPRSALVPDAAEEATAARVLVGMGFRHADAVTALRATGNNNVEVAANRLLAAAAAEGAAAASGGGTGDDDHSHTH